MYNFPDFTEDDGGTVINHNRIYMGENATFGNLGGVVNSLADVQTNWGTYGAASNDDDTAVQTLLSKDGSANLETAASAYSAERGLAGTALPAAAADAAGGLPISDAGGQDLDTLLGRLDVAVSTRNATAPLTDAGTRSALGMAAADLDT